MDIRPTGRSVPHVALVVGLVVALYAGVPLAFAGNLYVMSLVVASLTIGGVALAWALLGNLGGLVSFGHAAFFGVGSYASAILVMKAGWNPYLAMVAAGGIGVGAALLIGLPAFRLRGPYFA